MEQHDLERLKEVRLRLQESPTDADAHRTAHSVLCGISVPSEDAWNQPVVRAILERLFEHE